VRVHRDHEANLLADALDARALTNGRELFFNAGEFRPDSEGGQRLIAHELAHVVQQRVPGATPQVQRAPKGSSPAPGAAKGTKAAPSICGRPSRKNANFPDTYIKKVEVSIGATSSLTIHWQPSEPTIPGIASLPSSHPVSPGVGICRLKACVTAAESKKRSLERKKKQLGATSQKLKARKTALAARKKALGGENKHDASWQKRSDQLQQDEQTWQNDKRRLDQDLKDLAAERDASKGAERNCCADCNDPTTSQTDGSLCTPIGGSWPVTGFGCVLSDATWARNPTFFQRASIAIHASPTSEPPGPPRSHGCARTTTEASEIIHDNSIKDTTIVSVSGTWASTKCFMTAGSSRPSARSAACAPQPKATDAKTGSLSPELEAASPPALARSDEQPSSTVAAPEEILPEQAATPPESASATAASVRLEEIALAAVDEPEMSESEPARDGP
jgi:hypothetical protein